jgi:hypothetical protein
MKETLRILLLASLLGGLVLVVTAETWNGLTPLKSTRGDVERILGLPTAHGFYQLEVGKVRIFYGAGDREADTCWGRAPVEVVTRISISLDVTFPISQIRNRSSLQLTRNSHHPDNATYSDEKKGIQYHFGMDDGEVYDLTYWPNKKDCDNHVNQKEPENA